MPMEKDKKRIIIGMGSNHQAPEAIRQAKALIERQFGQVSYSHEAYTKPIGIPSADFLNCLFAIHSDESVEAVNEKLKAIERACGNTPELRKKNIVVMDLDILLYEDQQLHAKDWQRPYVTEMIKELIKHKL